MDKAGLDHMRIVEALRRARIGFHNALCRRSARDDPAMLRALRSDNMFVLAEFLFLLDTFDLCADPDALEAYIQRHNAQIAALLEDPQERAVLGLEPPRLRRGLFTEAQITKARANLSLDPAGLDQVDVQRLTIMLFSPETMRRLLAGLEDAGFLDRLPTPYGSRVIRSHGVIEEVFRTYLDEVRTKLG